MKRRFYGPGVLNEIGYWFIAIVVMLIILILKACS